jgi:redox-sensitive bicupin YhaK (pirin superfamily)
VQKRVLGVFPSPAGHWVGDGFPVRSLFSYDNLGQHLSPFLLLDYAGPVEFPPATRPRGVGEHPHRGFETVTIVYSGEVAHRDSTGGGGVIGPGDVQWMTAAAGILHEEFHSPAFTRSGGTLEMAQLWVNLPAAHKMSAPRYQTVSAAAIPRVPLPDQAGHVRVIAGHFADRSGPAATFTDLNVWDVRLVAGCAAVLPVPEGHNSAIAVLKGSISADGSAPVGPANLLVLDRAGDTVHIEARSTDDAVFLVLSGVPIDEPIVGHGPFVMNSRDEIQVAIKDFSTGQFGRLPPQVIRAAQVVGAWPEVYAPRGGPAARRVAVENESLGMVGDRVGRDDEYCGPRAIHCPLRDCPLGHRAIAIDGTRGAEILR